MALPEPPPDSSSNGRPPGHLATEAGRTEDRSRRSWRLAVASSLLLACNGGGTPLTGTEEPPVGPVDPPSEDVFFRESFEDGAFSAREWYDGSGGSLSDQEHIEGSTRSFECHFPVGAQGCAGGTPGRHGFEPSESVYLGYWVKYSDGYIGSGLPFHPHEFHFFTTEDGEFVGPSYTRLTLYIEQVGGQPHLGIQDGANVDPDCVLFTDGTFDGCGGSPDTYPFTEDRSVATCNGILGDLDLADCFAFGPDQWNSLRIWRAPERAFTDAPGAGDKTRWHFVEAFFEMNSIVDGVGIPDGRIRYWFDGDLLISSDRILMRTGARPNQRFNQFIIAPYIGAGSPVDQRMWLDDLTVAPKRP